MGIDAFFEPRSIAVFGASPGKTSFSNLAIRNLKNHGCRVPITPIHAEATEIDGLACRPSLDRLDSPPDLCVIGVRADRVLSVVEDCVRLGVPAATIVAAGFAELGDDEGQALQQKVSQLRARSKLRLIGPNTLGVASFSTNVVSIASGNIPAVVPRGPVAMITQSGGVALSVMLRGIPKGLGFSHIIALGNEIDVTLAEVIEYLALRDDVGIILCYVEAVRHRGNFRRALDLCNRLGKPVVLLKGGQTKAGQRATASHTGSLAGSGQVWRSVIEQCGAINAESVDHMIALAAIFSRHGSTSGRTLGAFCVGGGLTVLLTDMLDKAGIQAPELSESTRREIKRALPDVSPNNPCDMGGLYLSGDGSSMGSAVRAMAADANIDALVIAYCPVIAEREQVIGGTIASSGKGVDKPIVVLSYESRPDPDSHKWFRDAGMVVIDQPDAGVQALKSWLEYKPKSLSGDRPPEGTEELARRKQLCSLLSRRVDEKRLVLLEDEAKHLLAAYGVPVPIETVARNESEVMAAGESIGYPVALKVLAADMIHRGIGNGVILGIGSETQLREAFLRLKSKTQSLSDVRYLVQKMAQPGTEFLIGGSRDPDIGLTLMVASGGVNAEAINNTKFFALPVQREILTRVLSEWPIVKHSRDPVDVDLLAQVIMSISRLLVDGADYIRELDVNPVIIARDGKVALAVDALLVVGEPTSD